MMTNDTQASTIPGVRWSKLQRLWCSAVRSALATSQPTHLRGLRPNWAHQKKHSDRM